MDALIRRTELVNHALQFGWLVRAGVLEFSAYRVTEGAQTRRTVRITLSATGTVTGAMIDGQPVAGPGRLAQVIAALRRGAPSYRAGRVSDKASAAHWVPRQQRSGRAPQALCGVRVSGSEDFVGRWRWTRDPIDCRRCISLWGGAVTVLRNWNVDTHAPPTIFPNALRVYGGAATGRGLL